MTTMNQVGVGLQNTTGTGTFVGAQSPTLVTPRIGQINDTSGNAILNFTPVTSAVNYFTMFNNATNNPPAFESSGSDSNIGMTFLAKGTGNISFQTTAFSSAIYFATGTGYQHITNFTFANTAATQTVTWPDASGTVAFTSSSSGVVNSGTTSQIAYYASSGTTLSGLATANNSVLATNGSGVPAMTTSLPSAVQVAVGSLNSGTSASSTTFWRGDGTWASASAVDNGFTTQHVVTGSRAINGIYQNTTGKTMMVTVSNGNSGVGVGQGIVYSDSSSTPTTGVAAFSNPPAAIGGTIPVTFMVLNGNYYQVTSNSNTLLYWTEWY